MQSTLALAVSQARDAGAAQIHVLRMRVGRMSGVVPESLEFAFEVLRAGTPAAGASLKVELVEPACWCESCQAEFESADLSWACPRCQQLSRTLRRGTELELVSMEIS